MKKRFISIFICIIILFHGLSVLANNMIKTFKYDDWKYAVSSPEGWLVLSNPVDSSSEDGTLHLMEYASKITLNENTLYTLSMRIKSDTEFSDNAPTASISFSSSQNNIVFTVKNVSNEWEYVSAPFATGTSGEFGLTALIQGLSEESTFFIDNITFTQTSYHPVSMFIEGPRSVYIPRMGFLSYEYRANTIDNSGNSVSMLSGYIEIDGEVPHGVSFNSETSTLTIESMAPLDADIKLVCHPADGSTLKSSTLTVKTTNNILANGNFEDTPLYNMWDSEMYDFSIFSDSQNQYAQIPTHKISSHEYEGCIAPTRNYYLEAGTMYVFRAKVRSDSGYASRRVTSKITLAQPSVLNFDISNIGGDEWTNVVSAFIPSLSGIYDFKINVYTIDERPVYIDDIVIQIEELKPTYINFSVPVHISIPKSGVTTVPIAYQVYDQMGQVFNDATFMSVSPENQGVSVNDNTIKISSWAASGAYLITAESEGGAFGKCSILINAESIGDGDFESTAPSEFWTTANPSEFTMSSIYAGRKPVKGISFGQLIMNGNVSALLSNSVKRYDEGKSYVFEAAMVKVVPDIETVVTVLIMDINSNTFDDSVVVGQFLLSGDFKKIKQVFTPSSTTTGKLMIAFNTPAEHDSQVILLDDINVINAEVSVANVYVGGSPYVDKVIFGRYKFNSNFDATDASTYRWFMSSTANGVFTPIAGQTTIDLPETGSASDTGVTSNFINLSSMLEAVSYTHLRRRRWG